ncbi:MAG: lamin tail domain-containing protein [Saprospiraceae bacterium]|nr:lamin tail domain-containing protein [Saprospiraceae bacterium]
MHHLLSILLIYTFCSGLAAGSLEDAWPADHKLSSLTQAIEPYAIVITEILADPTPSIGLPEVEYVELFNRSNQPIHLDDLKFVNSERAFTLSHQIVPPGRHVLLCDIDDTLSLNIYGQVAGIASFPALVNGGDDLSIVNLDGELIHAVSYTSSWYHDKDKEEGGYALEMINHEDPCAGASNWGASQSLIGGTPGSVNSIANPDSTSTFELESLMAESTQIILSLSKVLGNQATADAFTFSPTLSIAEVNVSEVGNTVVLLLSQALEPGTDYIMYINELEDCQGQILSTKVEFDLAKLPAAGDLIINEVLFNPRPGGSDFVELYNTSSQSVLAPDLFIANLGFKDDIEKITTPLVIGSKQYMVLTADRSNTLAQYQVGYPDRVVETRLPSFPDQSGNVTLYRVEGNKRIVLDAFDYSEEYHLELLKDQNGVSLERISSSSATNDPANWHSAAESVGYATPTAPNSQLLHAQADQRFAIAPRIFSPDGDGQDDFMLLTYAYPASGYRTTIRIFDAGGRMVRQLENQTTLSSEGIIKWDGTSEEGTKAATGIYTVLVEAFVESGETLSWRETCVLANRLH